MTDRYQKIRDALAMGPTPGPWAACRTNSGTFVKSERLAGYFVEVRHCRTTQDVNADAHLIAACDPGTIRELLEERDALVEALAAQQPVGMDEAWRQKAAEWLEAKAVEQEATNQRWPDHAAAYKEWRDRPGVLRYLAAQVLAAQQQEGAE